MTSGCNGDVKRGAAKAVGSCVLSLLLTMVAHGGISDALGASGPPRLLAPVPPSIAATPPSLDTPAGGTIPEVPAGSPRNPTPMPAPASSNHYVGPAKASSAHDQ